MEEWREIEGWPYEVSSYGRVRRSTPACRTHPGRILKPSVTRSGYLRVWLSRNGTERQRFTVHRLVAGAFIGPAPIGHQVNHKNAVKADNRVDNLEYVTGARNREHAAEMDLLPRGDRHGRAKLTADDVRAIRHRYDGGGVSQIALANEYGVNQTMVGFIVRRVSWAHVN